MGEIFIKNIHIQGQKDDIRGYSLTVFNADTNKIIPGVASVRLDLNSSTANIAHVTYYETNDQGHPIAGDDGKPIVHTVEVENPGVDLTALESSTQQIGSYAVMMRADRNVAAIMLEDDANDRRIGLTPQEAIALHAYLTRILDDLKKWVPAKEPS